jgi:tetratricopeptide (TPR) repeat protein
VLLCLLCLPLWQDAQSHWSAGDRRAALDAAEVELQERPDDQGLRLSFGAWLLEVQRPAAALDALSPLDARADSLRASAHYILARYEEALALLDPGDPIQILMIVDSLLALSRTDEVGPALDRAAAVLGEGNPRVLALRGRMLAVAGRHADAVPLFRLALESAPHDRQALFGLGQSLVRSGEREEGLLVLQRHRELLPLLDRRDFALQALSLDPAQSAHHAQLGDIERELGRTDDAIARYQRAASLAEADELTPIVLRHARLLIEDRSALDEAVALLADAATRVRDARLPVRAGDLLMTVDRPGEALEHFHRAQSWRPDDRQIRARVEAAARAAVERAR